ncbi:hypothetical protein GCM10008019_35130 [Deinococcus soli (ex Cha et al. 2016)]|nr:hypothetical protein GCM10008019_35130 [Deinococcus soli (ex Cha et al. 2016)]
MQFGQDLLLQFMEWEALVGVGHSGASGRGSLSGTPAARGAGWAFVQAGWVGQVIRVTPETDSKRALTLFTRARR